MTRSENKKASRSVKSTKVELELGDEGLRVSSAPHGLFSNTYDASASLRLRGRLLHNLFHFCFMTHDAMKYEV